MRLFGAAYLYSYTSFKLAVVPACNPRFADRDDLHLKDIDTSRHQGLDIQCDSLARQSLYLNSNCAGPEALRAIASEPRHEDLHDSGKTPFRLN